MIRLCCHRLGCTEKQKIHHRIRSFLIFIFLSFPSILSTHLRTHPSFSHKYKHSHAISLLHIRKTMSALLKTLTFNALQKKSILSRHCANHELLSHIISKWEVPEEDTYSTVGTSSGINDCVYLKTSKDGSTPDRLVFEGNRDNFRYDRTLFVDLGSPLCLYRLGCTFPSAAHIEQTCKSVWWSALTHKATGKFLDSMISKEESHSGSEWKRCT